MKLFTSLFLLSITLFGQAELRDLNQPTNLAGEWSFHSGDNPQWASPNFDDSQWPRLSVPGPGHPITATFYWYRFRILNQTSPPASTFWITLPAIAPSYEVFANGTRVGSFGPPPGEKIGLLRPRVAAFPIPATVPFIHIAIRAAWTVPPTALLVAPNWQQPSVWAGSRPIVDGQLAKLERDALTRNQPFALLTIAALTAGIFLLAVPGLRRDKLEYLFAGAYLVSGALIRWLQAWTPPPIETVGWSLLGNTLLFLFLICNWMGFVGSTFAPSYTARLLQVGLSVYALWCTAGWLLWTLAPELLGIWQRFFTLNYALGIAFAFWWVQRRSPGNLGLKLAVGLFVTSALGAAFASFAPALAPLAAPEFRGVAVLILGIAVAFLLNQRTRRQEQERQRLGAELAAASEVQALLLSSSQATDSVTVNAVYLPASEVGGDFYQVLDCEDGSRLVVVGDVSGKGLRAAMLVSVAVGALRATSHHSPANVLAVMNTALCGRTGGGFVTCCCARFDAQGNVTLASAGHPAPYADGHEVEMEMGLPLGIVPGTSYTEHPATGTQFTLVSDGVIEAENPQRELFGFDRTRAISTQPAQSIAEAAKQWGQTDDITVVTVRRQA